MEKTKKIKLFIGLFYLILVALFLYYLFSKFTFQQLTSYDFIKDNVEFKSFSEPANLLISSSAMTYTFGFIFCLFLGVNNVNACCK